MSSKVYLYCVYRDWIGAPEWITARIDRDSRALRSSKCSIARSRRPPQGHALRTAEDRALRRASTSTSMNENTRRLIGDETLALARNVASVGTAGSESRLTLLNTDERRQMRREEKTYFRRIIRTQSLMEGLK